MSLAAVVVSTQEIEKDPSCLEGMTKECYACDSDNPRAVPRKTCKACGGTGREGLAALEAVEELRAAKSSKKPEELEDSDLYLQY
jgi:hypothetical protein